MIITDLADEAWRYMYSMVNAFFLNEHSDYPLMFQKLASKKLIAHCDNRFELGSNQ